MWGKRDHAGKGSARCGFTLIELLIVVAIIGILAAIAIPNFLQAQTRAKVSRVHSEFKSLATALESYYVDNNAYPGQGSPYPPQWGGYAKTSDFLGKYLSTPIVYISGLQSWKDPFATSWEMADPPRWGYKYAFVTTGYLSATGNYMEWKGQKVYQWLLHSNGPDVHNDNFELVSWPDYVPYDSKNGIISSGDIFKFGPGDLRRASKNLLKGSWAEHFTLCPTLALIC